MQIHSNFLSYKHSEQDAPDKNKTEQQGMLKVRQELNLSIKYEKPRQDVGVFYVLNLDFV
ncbi:hypothetical protein A7P53_15900 [Acinetobacter defluvii]|nr:hypothetical protein [Acinetobacter defluvii]